MGGIRIPRIIFCIECKEKKEHWAKGKCRGCYNRVKSKECYNPVLIRGRDRKEKMENAIIQVVKENSEQTLIYSDWIKEINSLLTSRDKVSVNNCNKIIHRLHSNGKIELERTKISNRIYYNLKIRRLR